MGIIAFILYFEVDNAFVRFYNLVFAIILILITIFSSFYVNEKIKIGSLLLIIVGVLIFIFSASYFSLSDIVMAI